MPRAFIGLGSNLDSPRERVVEALRRLQAVPGITVQARSSLYRTPPWGVIEQPPFINAVAELAVSLTPEALLDALLATERAMGRVRLDQQWGPRRIDLDLLHIDGETRDTPELQLPHPRLHGRAFVLLPWAEIAGDLEIPGSGRIADLLQGVDHAGIQRLP